MTGRDWAGIIAVTTMIICALMWKVSIEHRPIVHIVQNESTTADLPALHVNCAAHVSKADALDCIIAQLQKLEKRGR